MRAAVNEVAAGVQDWSLAEGEAADNELAAKVQAAGAAVNEADKAALIAASAPVYAAFAAQVRGGAELVSRAQALADWSPPDLMTKRRPDPCPVGPNMDPNP